METKLESDKIFFTNFIKVLQVCILAWQLDEYGIHGILLVNWN